MQRSYTSFHRRALYMGYTTLPFTTIVLVFDVDITSRASQWQSWQIGERIISFADKQLALRKINDAMTSRAYTGTINATAYVRPVVMVTFYIMNAHQSKRAPIHKFVVDNEQFVELYELRFLCDKWSQHTPVPTDCSRIFSLVARTDIDNIRHLIGRMCKSHLD